MKRIILILVVLTLILGTVLAVKLTRQAADRRGPPGSSGIIEGTRAQVSARLGARIESMAVREGDVVTAGQVLVELDCAEANAMVAEADARVEAAKAQVAAAQAQAEAVAFTSQAALRQARSQKTGAGSYAVQEANARRQSQRAARLDTEGAMATAQRETLDTAADDLGKRRTSALEAADAAGQQAKAAQLQATAATEQVRAAERQVAAGEAALARAKAAQAECHIMSPVPGTVTVRAKEPGEVVLPGTTLYEVTDVREVKVIFYVANADLGRVTTGQAVTVMADAWPDQTFHGSVRRVSPEAEFTPRTIQTRSDRDRLVYAIEATLQNPDGRLRVGMPVEVALVP